MELHLSYGATLAMWDHTVLPDTCCCISTDLEAFLSLYTHLTYHNSVKNTHFVAGTCFSRSKCTKTCFVLGLHLSPIEAASNAPQTSVIWGRHKPLSNPPLV